MWAVITRDLAEFVTVVKTDTAVKASTVVSAVAMKSGGAAESAAAAAPSRSIANDAALFQSDCADHEAEEFSTFKKKFDVGSKTAEISQLLKDDGLLTQRHADLVPDKVSYHDFWLRYFFRIKQQATRQAAVQQLGLGLAEDEDDDLGWDQEDEEADKPKYPPPPPPASKESKPQPQGAAALKSDDTKESLARSALEADLAEAQQGRAAALAQVARLEASASVAEQALSRLRAASADTGKSTTAGDDEAVGALKALHAAELAGLREKHDAELKRLERVWADAECAAAAKVLALEARLSLSLSEAAAERSRLSQVVRDLEAKLDAKLAATEVLASAEGVAAEVESARPAEVPAEAAPTKAAPTEASPMSTASTPEPTTSALPRDDSSGVFVASPVKGSGDGSETEDWGDDWS